jgi:hypothetical protein
MVEVLSISTQRIHMGKSDSLALTIRLLARPPQLELELGHLLRLLGQGLAQLVRLLFLLLCKRCFLIEVLLALLACATLLITQSLTISYLSC